MQINVIQVSGFCDTHVRIHMIVAEYIHTKYGGHMLVTIMLNLLHRNGSSDANNCRKGSFDGTAAKITGHQKMNWSPLHGPHLVPIL